MGTSISFTDAIGSAVLTNQKIFPADRFSEWAPLSAPDGESGNIQGNGALLMFRFRSDYGAKFELRAIPSKLSGGLYMVDIADRLCYHLKNGGTMAIATGDALGTTYPTVGLLPDTTPELVLSDPMELEYTFRVSALNLAVSPVRMVCRYADQ